MYSVLRNPVPSGQSPVIRDFLPRIAEPVMDRWGENKCRHADCHDCFPLDDSPAARHREIPVSEPREPSQHSPLGSCDNRAGVDDHSIGIFLKNGQRCSPAVWGSLSILQYPRNYTGTHTSQYRRVSCKMLKTWYCHEFSFDVFILDIGSLFS